MFKFFFALTGFWFIERNSEIRKVAGLWDIIKLYFENKKNFIFYPFVSVIFAILVYFAFLGYFIPELSNPPINYAFGGAEVNEYISQSDYSLEFFPSP